MFIIMIKIYIIIINNVLFNKNISVLNVLHDYLYYANLITCILLRVRVMTNSNKLEFYNHLNLTFVLSGLHLG